MSEATKSHNDLIRELGDHAQVQENVDGFSIVTPGSSVYLTTGQFLRLLACYAGRVMGRNARN